MVELADLAVEAPDGRGGVVRRRFTVTGLVQGVGMRPHLARLARELGLVGGCSNTSAAVHVEIEGPAAAVAEFTTRLVTDRPPLARIDDLVHEELTPRGTPTFTIDSSKLDTGAPTLIAPDIATCADCLRELHDPTDRRYRHPFITCTNCGPRFTITTALPYDRPNTTMAGFPMCDDCAREYADPTDRRYHAQPIACHHCGPTLTLNDTHGMVRATGADALNQARAHLAKGDVVAVKGIGGYHLACRADDPAAVSRLRERKHRPHQPFAIMVATLGEAAAIAEVSPSAQAHLSSPARPIVLVPRRRSERDSEPAVDPVSDGARFDDVCEAVAPGLDELGIMLPYTPVQQLMFDPPALYRALVMTSGNISGQPLCFEDDDALTRLGSIADAFLTHDRPIVLPCDDSVTAIDDEGGAIPVRRSRGYAPLPLRVAPPAAAGPPGPTILATGGELKNTLALVVDGAVYLSGHLGDQGSLEARRVFERSLDHAIRLHAGANQPSVIATDTHPGYALHSWAEARAQRAAAELVEVQHHQAHLAALAAEHDWGAKPLLGLVFDGTGYGCDATVWGGELLLLSDHGADCERRGHLRPLPLPGGDAGVRHPARMAAAAMLAAGLDLAPGRPSTDALTAAERALLPGLLASTSGWVPTSSVGRLFDVVSSLLGVCHRVSYEAQAAIELEALATRWERDRAESTPRLTLPLPVIAHADGLYELNPLPLVLAIDAALHEPFDPGQLAYAFHLTLAREAAKLAATVADEVGTDIIGLTGGVFQNRLLTRLIRCDLADLGLRTLEHRIVPPNDGGLALGQAWVAMARMGGDGRP